MNRKQTEEIKNSIKMYGIKLRTIRPHLTEDKVLLNEKFNKLLIEKAVLRDKLMHKSPSLISKIVKKINSGKRELICDYFKN